MGERRSLVAGLPTEPTNAAEREFVYRDRSTAPKPSPVAAASRSPFTTRLRDDYAKALKRASLERQIAGVVPNTLQDILEEALAPWLRDNGYLDA